MPVSNAFEELPFGSGRGLNGRVTGLLRLIARPGTPSGGTRDFQSFTDTNIIIAASNWTITGSVSTSVGESRSFVVKVREDINQLDISLGSLRWRTSWPGNEVDVINDAPNDRLSITIDRPLFSSNDQAWFLDLPSVFHVERAI